MKRKIKILVTTAILTVFFGIGTAWGQDINADRYIITDNTPVYNNFNGTGTPICYLTKGTITVTLRQIGASPFFNNFVFLMKKRIEK